MKFYIRTPNKTCSSASTDLQIPASQNQRADSKEPPKKPLPPKPHPKAPPKSPPSKKKKINFSALKKDTVNSLNEVEHFLCNFQNICKYIKLYKILR